jgi:hypothetical protein
MGGVEAEHGWWTFFSVSRMALCTSSSSVFHRCPAMCWLAMSSLSRVLTMSMNSRMVFSLASISASVPWL